MTITHLSSLQEPNDYNSTQIQAPQTQMEALVVLWENNIDSLAKYEKLLRHAQICAWPTQGKSYDDSEDDNDNKETQQPTGGNYKENIAYTKFILCND